jgi:thiol-disulfide isomerase/thioredoxin
VNAPAAPRSPHRLRIALAIAGLAVLFGSGVAAYLAASGGVTGPAETSPAGIGWAEASPPVPELRFLGAAEKRHTLADFRGKVVLLNIWATWCAPCREEMPALDRLQQALGGPDFEVVALSIDGGGMAVVRSFYDEVGIRALAPYVDASMQAGSALRLVGVPTTLLLDRGGKERWRKAGPAQWDAPEIVEALRSRIRAEHAGS